MNIFPDLHGRTFWQRAAADNPSEELLFLGDYLDPYEREGISFGQALKQLLQVIDLWKHSPQRVTLLLGNHDLPYLWPDRFHCSRHNYAHEELTGRLFWQYISAFSMSRTLEAGGQTFVFTHAGILPQWAEGHPEVFGPEATIGQAARLSNDLLQTQDSHFLQALDDVSFWRGGGDPCSSMVWADAHEFAAADPPAPPYQVFGHTQLACDPIITPSFACLDCRRPFRLNETDGTISALES